MQVVRIGAPGLAIMGQEQDGGHIVTGSQKSRQAVMGMSVNHVVAQSLGGPG